MERKTEDDKRMRELYHEGFDYVSSPMKQYIAP